MPLCSAFMSARISAFSSRSSASSRIALACLSSSSVCFACSASTRSASRRQRSASAAARSPSDWNPISISSAMFARRVAPASSVCRRDIFWMRCIASTALCSSIARMRSSSSSSCAADASCAAHSASRCTSLCFVSVWDFLASVCAAFTVSWCVPSSRSSSRTRRRRNSFSLACSRAFLATAKTSRVRAARPRIPGLHAGMVRP